MRELQVRYLGKKDFLEVTAELQERLHAQRMNNEITDTLLLFEPQNHVYTLGSTAQPRGDKPPLVPAFKEGYTPGKEVTVLDVSRGGHVTYHGPGQLLGYFIGEIPTNNFESFLDNFELALLQVVQASGFPDARIRTEPMWDAAEDKKKRQRGIWLGDDKALAMAFGFKGKSGNLYTRHGFALNVYPDMKYFNNINPCGMDVKFVSLKESKPNQHYSIDDIAYKVVESIQTRFNYPTTEIPLPVN